MLIDYFLYNDEIELLQFRYNYYKETVTKFVVSEANYTYTGIPKEYNLEKHLEQCNISTDKFIILKVDLSPKNLHISDKDIECAKLVNSTDLKVLQYFARRRIQRNAVKEILTKKLDTRLLYDESMESYPIEIFTTNDNFEFIKTSYIKEPLFLISDVDEFINLDKLETVCPIITSYKSNCLKIPLIFLESVGNQRLTDMEGNNIIYNDNLVLCGLAHLYHSNPYDLRNNLTDSFPPIRIDVNEIVDFNFGWLFHNMGTIDQKLKKYSCSANSINITTDYRVSKTSANLLNIESNNYSVVEYDIEHLPYIIHHYPKVKQYLLPNSKTAKIVDFVLYKDEEDLFRLRYKLLNDKVDLFVVVQGSTSFNGIYDYYTLLNNKNFIKFCEKHNFDRKKIRVINYQFSEDFSFVKGFEFNPNYSPDKEGITKSHVVHKSLNKKVFQLIDDNDNKKPFSRDNIDTKINYVREKILRDQLNVIVNEFTEDTVFFSGDIDEILNPIYFDDIIKESLKHPDKIIKIPLIFCEFRTDRRLVDKKGKNVGWDKGLFACTTKPLLKNSNTHIRDEYQLQSDIIYLQNETGKLEDMGWHLSWVNTDYYNRTKIINHNFYNSLNYNYPISTVALEYLESLVNSKINHRNIITKVEYTNDEEFIKLIAKDTILSEFFLKEKTTLLQRVAYYKAKYLDIVNNKDSLSKTYKTIFSYLPTQTSVIDYSANLGLALKAAFRIWGCAIKGLEYEKILHQNSEFVSLYENYDFNLKPYFKNFSQIKNTINYSYLSFIPIELIDNFDAYDPNKICDDFYSLGLCLDFAQYLKEFDSNRLIETVTSNTDTVLFSSFNPKEKEFGYYNCQWQSYWIEKFKQKDFVAYEIRDKIAGYDYVPKHFKTNLLLFSKKEMYGLEEITKPNLYFEGNKIIEHDLNHGLG